MVSSSFARLLKLTALALLFIFFVVACSTKLRVVSDRVDIEALSTDGPAEGIIYFLPKAELEFQVTRRLDKCEIASEGEQRGKPIIDFAIEATSTEQMIADKSHPYLIDYSHLENGFKEIDLTVTFFENGTLKTLNAKITDKTAETFSHFLQGSIRIAKMAAGIPSTELRALSPCKKGTVDALDRWTTSVKLKKDKQNELDELLKKETHTDSEKATIKALKKKIKELTPLITRALDQISWTENYRWNIDELGGGHATNFMLVPQNTKKLSSFFKPDFWKKLPDNDPRDPTPVIEIEEEALKDAANSAKIIWKLTSEALLKRRNCVDSNSCAGMGALRDNATNAGRHLIYRVPGEAMMYVCNTSCNASQPRQIPIKEDVILKKRIDIPQAGVHLALPLKNELFDGQTLSVTFRESGSLEEFKYISAAQFEAAGKAFNDSTKTVGGFVDTLRSEELDETKTKTELLKAQAELIKAQNALRELQSDTENE